MRFLYLFLVFPILALTCCSSIEITVPDDPVNFLSEKWLAQKADLVAVNGEILSSAEYEPEGWLDAVVPGTVLSTLLNNRLIPDPFFSMNNELILDINDVGVEHYTYWFYTKFNFPPEVSGRRIWLNLRGINYKAEVYLNGSKVNATILEGMFRRFNLDITEHVTFSENNILAIIVL
jgi:beta-galactosidase/beta-glucuronidase